MSSWAVAAADSDGELARAPAAVQPLPLRWQDSTGDFDVAAQAEAMRVMAAVAALEERPAHPVDESGGLEVEVARLHQKMQLLMEMVGGLLRAQLAVPAPVPVRLTASGLRWRSTEPPAVQAEGLVELWLHPACPEPVRLPVRVLSLSPEPGGVQIEGRFGDLPEALATALEKHVFLRHRREVAEARQHRR